MLRYRALLSAGFAMLSALIGWLFVIQVVSTVEDVQTADAILLLGAGVNMDGSPSPVLAARIDRAADLYHAGYAPLIAVTGGSIDGLPPEATSARRELIAQGVPASAILLETASQNTWENVENIAPLLNQQEVESVLLVSSSFHMWRAKLITERAGYSVYLAPASHPSEYLLFRRDYLLVREVGATLIYFVLSI